MHSTLLTLHFGALGMRLLLTALPENMVTETSPLLGIGNTTVGKKCKIFTLREPSVSLSDDMV